MKVFRGISGHQVGIALCASFAVVAGLAIVQAFPLEKDSGQAEMAAQFRELDVNEDGYLSGREAKPYLRYDEDRNGRITEAEFVRGARREGNQRGADGVDPAMADKEFLELDINEDGRLTGKEIQTVRQFDTNGDGRVTREEFMAGRLKKKSGEKPSAAVAGDKPPKPIRPATEWDKKLTSQFDGGKRWAILIGVDKYSKKPLHCCVADARMQSDALKMHCGYDRTRVILVTDDQKVESLQPRKANLQKQVSELLKKVGESDTVLVAFAGHGFSLNGQSFLCPLDFDGDQPALTGWRIDELRSLLHDCRAAQKLLVLDCCHSGGAVSVGGADPSVKELGAAFEHAQGLITLASCRTNETSMESRQKGHGLFTLMMVAGLKGAADFDTNGIVDSDELYRHVLSSVPIAANELEAGHKQTPVRLIGQDVVGVFALSRPRSGVADTAEDEKKSELQPGDTLVNSIGMKLVVLPQGIYVRGSPEDEFRRHEDEDRRPVVLTPSPIFGVYEVTQHEYQTVTRSNPGYFCSTGDGAESVEGTDTSRFPVENVTWQEANDFCRRLSSRPEERAAKRTYRLPTEAEWEYACRANSLTTFHVGELISSDQANFRADKPYWNSPIGTYLGRTRSVGSYFPNGFGLYDMHGNVAEWCADWYVSPLPNGYSWTAKGRTAEDTNLLLEEFVNAIKKGLPISQYANPQGPLQGETRVVRGGGFSSDGTLCRSAVRRFQRPGTGLRSIGFRVVCQLQK